MRKKHIPVARVLPYRYNVSFYTKREDMVGLGDKDLDYFEGQYGVTMFLGDSSVAVGVFNRDVSTLVHECVHVMTGIFDRIGMPIRWECDEAFAYSVQQLFIDLKGYMK